MLHVCFTLILNNFINKHFDLLTEIPYAADLLVLTLFTWNGMDALSIQCLQHKMNRLLCFCRAVYRGFSVASGPWCLTPPFLCHRWRCTLFSPRLCGNQHCMLLCWCLSTAKVSPMCLMDLPVRFRVPPAKPSIWALPLFVPWCQWVEAGWGWDRADNGCFVLLLDVLKLYSCGPGDAWSNRDRQRLWKRRAVALFSTAFPAANIHHLLQPLWITTLTTFHTYKKTL